MSRWIIFLFFLPVCVVAQNFKEPLLVLDFEDLTSSYEDSLLNMKQIEYAKDRGVDGSGCIKVSYIGYDRGSERVVRWIPLPYPLEEATLNFAVKFEKDFQFVRGGKLHGLGPEKPVTGGGEMHPEGWSTRIMFKGFGKVISYIYHQDKPGKWGDGSGTVVPVFTPGEYNYVSLYTKVNSPASSSNGIFEIWVDGELIVKNDSLQLRSVETESALINKFLFSTFHGGNKPSYAPQDSSGNYTTEVAWFDNFEVYEGKHIKGKNPDK